MSRIKQIKRTNIGSISSGTLRTEDLLPAFLTEAHANKLSRTSRNLVRSIGARYTLSKSVDDFCENCGHKYLYHEVGRHEARSLCYHGIADSIADGNRKCGCAAFESAYWMNDADEDVNTLIDILSECAPAYFYFGTHPGDGSDFGYWLSDSFAEDFDGLKVDDLSEIPKGYTGEVLLVNDHGNMSLYRATRGRLRENWSIV